MTPFPRTFIIKGNANTERISPSCPFPALVTRFPDITFINEETTGCITEEAKGAITERAKGAITAPKNPPSYLFHVLMFQLHHQLIDLNYLMTFRFY